METGGDSQVPPTPVSSGFRVPPGHILANSKWKGTTLSSAIQGAKAKLLYEENIHGIVDFFPSSDSGIVYIPESDLVSGSAYKRKLVKLRKSATVRGIVIAERTPTSSQYFSALQRFAVLELGLILLPVATETEAASLILQLAQVEQKSTGSSPNPFRIKRKTNPIDSCLLATVQLIPGLGEVKAKNLLAEFKSLKGIADASEKDLIAVIGKSSVQSVRAFFSRQPSR